MYARIEGPAAYDVLMNFEERWLKAAKRNGVKRLKKSDDSLLKIQRIPDIIGLSDLMYLNDNDPETWHVQVESSIIASHSLSFVNDFNVLKESLSKHRCSVQSILTLLKVFLKIREKQLTRYTFCESSVSLCAFPCNIYWSASS